MVKVDHEEVVLRKPKPLLEVNTRPGCNPLYRPPEERLVPAPGYILHPWIQKHLPFPDKRPLFKVVRRR